jgi:lysophospholipase L1-like esterase
MVVHLARAGANIGRSVRLRSAKGGVSSPSVRIVRVLLRTALALVIAVAVLEISFRLAGALIPRSRGIEGLAADHFVILCVGDSHTWGLGEGYPARLAARLAERSPRYRVVNYGVAGTNTAQLRKRFVSYLDRFHPQVVIFWGGVNNRHNRSETDVWEEAGVERASFARRLLDDSRVLRFIRMWQVDREMDHLLASTGAYVAPNSQRREGDSVWHDHRRNLFGEELVFTNVQGDHLPPAELARVTELDVRWMIEQTRARGIPFVAITYPFQAPPFLAPNAGIRAATDATGALRVDSHDAGQRFIDAHRERGEKPPGLYDKTLHPNQTFYDLIGDLVLEKLDEKGYL